MASTTMITITSVTVFLVLELNMFISISSVICLLKGAHRYAHFVLSGNTFSDLVHV